MKNKMEKLIDSFYDSKVSMIIGWIWVGLLVIEAGKLILRG